MEATTAKSTSNEHEGLPEAATDAQTELLRAIERCSYPTVKQLAHETNRTEGRVRQSLRSLVKQGLVRERTGGMHGTLYKLVPKEEFPAGLFDKMTNSPKKSQASSRTPQSAPKGDEEEEKEDDEPEILQVVNGPTSSSQVSRVEDLLDEAKRCGWTVEKLEARKQYADGMIRLSFIGGV